MIWLEHVAGILALVLLRSELRLQIPFSTFLWRKLVPKDPNNLRLFGTVRLDRKLFVTNKGSSKEDEGVRRAGNMIVELPEVLLFLDAPF